jgi:PhzF family phenazine biosynthesis protein
MKLSFTTLDVFTNTRYMGNPVAIIEVPAGISPPLNQAQKQSIAIEFNLSEIVFLHLPIPGDSTTSRNIDIFTSIAEVPFAGHPTIGASQYLLNLTQQNVTEVVTKAGPIPIVLNAKTGVAKVEVPFNFHIHKVTFACPLTPGISHPVARIVNGMSFIYVELSSLEALAKSAAIKNLHPETYDPSALDAG